MRKAMDLTMNDPDASFLERDRRVLNRRVTINGQRVSCHFSYYDKGQGPQPRAFYPIGGDAVKRFNSKTGEVEEVPYDPQVIGRSK